MRPPLHFVIPSLLFPPSSPSLPLLSTLPLPYASFSQLPVHPSFTSSRATISVPFSFSSSPVSVSLLSFNSLSLDSPSSSPSAVSRFLFRSFHLTRAPDRRVHLPLSPSLSPSPPFVSSLRLAPRLLNHFFSFSVPSPLQTSLPLTTDKHDDALLARHIRIAYTLARVQPSKKMS